MTGKAAGAAAETKSVRVRKRMNHRTRMTVILLLLFAAALAALVLVILLGRTVNKLPLPLPWSNERMSYTSAEQTAMQAQTAFSSGLCIGENNVANEAVTLDGYEKGGLFSIDDRSVVFAKDIFEKVYPASITKLMTAILAMKSDKMGERVTIQWQDLELESGSQVVGLRIGDTGTMESLLRGLLIHSGNDAAQAIARVVGGTQENFVKMMNEELSAIGATGSHFTNPTGLHDENHYTTVYDIYLMLNEAMKYDEFLNIAGVGVYDFQYWDADGNEVHVTLDSTDHYLTGETEPPKDVTVLGGKTGTTTAAGNCLAVLAQNAYGQFYISVIVGAQSKDILYSDMNMLLTQMNA